MNRFLSQKIRFFSFACISLLLFVHGYNLQNSYLKPYSSVNEPLTFTTFIEYFFANGALRFRIPMLFAISGYIYALQDKKPYWLRVKKRFKTLIIPFFIWSAIALLITCLWQQNSTTAAAVQRAALVGGNLQKPLSSYTISELLHVWAFRPLAYHLWFIRSLFIYNVMYPVIRYAVTRYPVIWFALLFLFWHSIFSILFIEGQGLFFFSFGVWLCKTNYPVHKKPDWFSYYLSWLFFLGISVIKTFMAFEMEPSVYTPYILYGLYDISVAAGIIAIWFGADPVVLWCMKRKWFVWLTSFSFIIYAFHVPMINYTTQLVFGWWQHFTYYRLLTYCIVPTLTFCLCIFVGAFFRLVWPKAYKLATGSRGI